MADFGNKVLGGSQGWIEDRIRGSLFTIGEDGTADSITVALKYVDVQSDWKTLCAIYKHADLSLVGTTQERTITPNLACTWETFNFIAPKPNLLNGVGYVLCVMAEALAGSFFVCYDAGAADQGHYRTYTYDGSYPNPAAFTHHLTDKYSIYCTYTPAGVGARIVRPLVGVGL